MNVLGESKHFALSLVPMSFWIPSLKIVVITREVGCRLVFHGLKGFWGLVNHYGPSIKKAVLVHLTHCFKLLFLLCVEYSCSSMLFFLCYVFEF